MASTATICLVGTAFGLSVGLPLVLSRRAAPTADRLFGALATTAALTLALIAAERSGLTASVPALDRLDFVLALIAGPLLYLYARTVTRPERTLQQSDLVHGLPALAVLGALGAWSSALVAWKPPFPAVLVIQMGYSGMAAATLLRSGRGPAGAGPRTAALAGPVVALAFLVHVGQILRILPSTRGVFNEAVAYLIPTALLAIGGLGFVQAMTSGSRPSPQKYRKSAVDTDTVREAIRRLDILMTTRRAYRDPRLTLTSLAATLGLSRHQLSQILNQHLGESLTDYLNRLRIEDVKGSLLNAENDVYTVEAVARTAGFASRSVFYRAFVRATGQTPTAWRRSGRAG